jgi:hypothetical protein
VVAQDFLAKAAVAVPRRAESFRQRPWLPGSVRGCCGWSGGRRRETAAAAATQKAAYTRRWRRRRRRKSRRRRRNNTLSFPKEAIAAAKLFRCLRCLKSDFHRQSATNGPSQVAKRDRSLAGECRCSISVPGHVSEGVVFEPRGREQEAYDFGTRLAPPPPASAAANAKSDSCTLQVEAAFSWLR